MRCFLHQDRDAIGVCIACGRGLCNECAVQTSAAVSCKGRCESDAARVVLMRDIAIRAADQQIKAAAESRSQSASSGWVFIGLGVLVLMANRQSTVGLVVGAGIVLLGTVLVIIVSNQRLDRSLRACPKCGYHLAGTSTGGCPECGWALVDISDAPESADRTNSKVGR